jgi:hypothetical protein
VNRRVCFNAKWGLVQAAAAASVLIAFGLGSVTLSGRKASLKSALGRPNRSMLT